MKITRSLTLTLHGLSSLAMAVIAFELPLNLVLNIDQHVVFVIYISATIVFFADFLNNLREYKYRMKFPDKAEVLDQEHNIFLLTIDLIATIPFGLLSDTSTFGLIQLIKIIRIGQYQSFWNKKAIRFSDYQRLAFFAFWIMIITHWMSCGWLSLHTYAGISDNLTLYIRSLYWSVVTLTTVGYGDIVPINNAETAYSMLVMLFGVGIYGYVIGNIANILSKRDPAKVAFQKNMDNLKAFVRYRELPMGLQNRIRDYYAYLWKKRLGYDELYFLNNLPSGLKREVEMHLKRRIIDRIPLFKETNNAFLDDIAQHLKPAIYTPGDIIIHEGDEGQEMYLVIKGRLKVYKNEDPEKQFLIKDGDFFGELALLNNKPRNANVQSITYSDVYVLKREVFEMVLAKHPGLAKKIKETAAARS
ncbi:MAG: cyclic nucleotide-binding domain-containing protein [Calditrichae bacterium]|nr:cyclic nucleotide-binding domain-containing protein [Calditrichota bacterium]MCB9058468.1 cyclic nucleotide-binding domain-containing protein [Calditrichia bacterium]